MLFASVQACDRPVITRDWARYFIKKNRLGAIRRPTTDRCGLTPEDLADDNTWRQEFEHVRNNPRTYGLPCPGPVPPSMILGVDETPLQYAPRIRGTYVVGERVHQVHVHGAADKRQCTATPATTMSGEVC